MGGSSKQTVGFWYQWAMHFGWCKGPVDAVLEWRAGGKTAWQGRIMSSQRIGIVKPNLWGGEDSTGGGQGGVVGDMDLMFGEQTQQPNSYLARVFGPQQSAHRGKLTTVFCGGKFGAFVANPKPVSLKVERILADWQNGVVWYPPKAVIGVSIGTPLALYFAFDTSGSMATVGSNDKSRLANMVAAVSDALDFIDTNILVSGTRVDIQLVRWSDTSSSTLYRSITSAGISSLKSWLAGLGASGGTDFREGLYGMTDFFAAGPPDAVKSVVFLTDGEPASTNGNQTQIITGAQQLVKDQVGVKVYAANIDSQNTIFTKFVDNTPDDSVPVIAGEDSAAITSILVASFNGVRAMNPAHIIYDSITHIDMQGEPVGVINDASFRAAADKLYAEGFGLCTDYDGSQENPKQFQQRICNVIGASLSQSRVDGLYYLDLIRGDVDLETLPIIGEDDVMEFSQDASVITETGNMVRVEWTDPTAKEERTTAPLYSQGNVRSAGRVIPQTSKYPEVPTESLALRLCARDLKSVATPLAKFTLTTRHTLRGLRPGQNARLQLPSEGIADTVVVIGSVDHGTATAGKMTIVAVQNVYRMPDAVYLKTQPGLWTAPDTSAAASPHQRAFEAPYIELASALSATDMAAYPADAGTLLTVATKPGNGVNYVIDTAAAGEDYADRSTGDWCPTATIPDAAGFLDTAFTLTEDQLLDRVDVGSWALWDEEIVRVDAIDSEALTLTLGRGCADTVPAQHAAASRIYFCGEWVGTDRRQYVGGDVVNAKLLTKTNTDQQSIDTATALPVTFNDRQARPYPPAGVTINGDSYPAKLQGDLLFTWVHRDRLLQADQLVDATAASIGPEAGTTYRLDIKSPSGALVQSIDAGSGTTLTVPAVALESYISQRVELYTVCDGLDCLQPAAREFNYVSGQHKLQFVAGYTPPVAAAITLQFKA